KAMVVTRSRLHAVKTKQAFDKYLLEHGYPYRALVAFSGRVNDGIKEYTEAGMNGFAEKQTAEMFKRPEFRFLIVAEKFQTGFDQLLKPAEDRYTELSDAERAEFKHQLGTYVRLYAFLSQVLPFADAELESLYAFARMLNKRLPADPRALPLEVIDEADMESYR